MIKYINAYETEDRTIFRDRETAELYELKCTIVKWYNELDCGNLLVTPDNITVSSGCLSDWLVKHRDKIMEFYREDYRWR